MGGVGVCMCISLACLWGHGGRLQAVPGGHVGEGGVSRGGRGGCCAPFARTCSHSIMVCWSGLLNAFPLEGRRRMRMVGAEA